MRRFETAEGTARLTDSMPVAADPGGIRPTRELLRIVQGVEGDRARVRFAPWPDYARAPPRLRLRGKLGWACTWKDELFLLHADAPLELAPDGRAVTGRIRVKPGERLAVSLSYAKADIGAAAPLGRHAEERLRATVEWWEDWSGRCAYDGPHRDVVVRSAITLKLMTFALCGAVVAAPTASLPEAVGGGRNWDYRYCWIRDAALTMRTFTGLDASVDRSENGGRRCERRLACRSAGQPPGSP